MLFPSPISLRPLYATYICFQYGHEILQRHGEIPINGVSVFICRDGDHDQWRCPTSAGPSKPRSKLIEQEVDSGSAKREQNNTARKE